MFVDGLWPTSHESRKGYVFGHWTLQNKGHERKKKQKKCNKKQYKTRVLSNKNESNTNNTSSIYVIFSMLTVIIIFPHLFLLSLHDCQDFQDFAYFCHILLSQFDSLHSLQFLLLYPLTYKFIVCYVCAFFQFDSFNFKLGF